jgi:hypothetical protein
MLTIAALLIGGIILLFVVLSVIGLVTSESSDQDAAAGVVRRR